MVTRAAHAILHPVTQPEGLCVEGTHDSVKALLRSVVRSALFSTEPAEVGPYELREKLGEGGFGLVFKAHDPKLDREVALKVLHGAQHRVSLVREAQVIARLSHPNIIHIYDVGELDGHVFIAMELVEGEPLRTWVEDRSVDEIVGAYLQAARALAAAHAAGIVHRDFKPDNALVNERGHVFVVDFGVARDVQELVEPEAVDRSVLETLTRTGGMIGTPAYMAPEQFAGHPADPRTDVFALCVALFEALHGKRPYAGDSVPTLAEAVSTGKREAPVRPLRRSLQAVLDRGLQLDPDRRFQTMDALIAALQRSLAPRRSWTLTVGAAAVVGVATAAAVAAGSAPTGDANAVASVASGERAAGADGQDGGAGAGGQGGGAGADGRDGGAGAGGQGGGAPDGSAAPEGAAAELEPGLALHPVLPGETLAEVAALYGTDAAALAELNGLDRPDAPLRAGDRIRVRATRPVDRQLILHEVDAGSTWASLAQRYDVREARLRLYNPQLGDTLDPGSLVTVYLTVAAGAVESRGQSVGRAGQGSIRGGTQLPDSELYTRNVPTLAWGSSFAVRHLAAALTEFRMSSGYTGPLVVGDMSKHGGGPLPPHRSHQGGRDVDIFLPVVPGVDLRQTGDALRRPALSEVDWVATARLVRALAETNAVQYIFLDWEKQQALHRGGTLAGWDRASLDRLIQWPNRSSATAVVRHSAGIHGMEIHVRFKCGPDEPDCVGPR